jgi:hypothetical protein
MPGFVKMTLPANRLQVSVSTSHPGFPGHRQPVPSRLSLFDLFLTI